MSQATALPAVDAVSADRLATLVPALASRIERVMAALRRRVERSASRSTAPCLVTNDVANVRRCHTELVGELTHSDSASRVRMVQLLKQHEGLRLKPYRDTTGHLTIGYGCNLDIGITLPEAEYLLWSRIQSVIDALTVALPWWGRLDEVRRSVLVDMAYNLGVVGLMKWPQTLAAIECGDYQRAAALMRASKWARQVGARATTLCRMLTTGTWPDED